MKTQKTLLMVLLVVSLTIITSQVYAGFSIRLEKDVRSSNIPAWPNEITFDLYDSETAPDLVASQDFSRGEWLADRVTKLNKRGNERDIVRFKADFTNTEDLTRDMELWVQLALDGVLKGSRKRVKSEAWAMFSNDTTWEENGSDIFYRDGNVAIGEFRAETIPEAKLHVKDSLRIEEEIDDGDVTLDLYSRGSGTQLFQLRVTDKDVSVPPASAFSIRNTRSGIWYDRLVIDSSGNIGIGTTSPQGALDVNGSIYQRGSEIHADYVFDPKYDLESIDEHTAFMWKERHLKAVPKAKQDKDGQDVVEYGAHLKGMLEELEKAHVYIAKLHESIMEQQQVIKKQQKAISALMEKMNVLEK